MKIRNILFLLLLTSCQPVTSVNHIDDSTEIIQPDTAAIISLMKNDDSLEAICPVKIITAHPIAHDEYSNYKDVYISYKNVSKKTITAIRFRWTGINAFGEPADMGTTTGEGSGFTDDKLRVGRSDDGTWEILSSDLKKITKAWVYEVAFSDGTKWSLE